MGRAMWVPVMLVFAWREVPIGDWRLQDIHRQGSVRLACHSIKRQTVGLTGLQLNSLVHVAAPIAALRKTCGIHCPPTVRLFVVRSKLARNPIGILISDGVLAKEVPIDNELRACKTLGKNRCDQSELNCRLQCASDLKLQCTAPAILSQIAVVGS